MLTVFQNVLIMLCYMAAGFAFVKTKKTYVEHTKTISGLLIYFCNPCLIVSSFTEMPYSHENTIMAVQFFGVTLFCQISFVFIMYLLFRRKYDNPKYRLMTVGSILGNVGFFGLPLVVSLFPDQPNVACYSIMYATGMNLLIFTLATYMITGDKKYMSARSAFINPATTVVICSIPLYFLQVSFPPFVANAVSLVGKMATPLCMILLGTRLASMDFKSIFCQPFAYVVCLLKLVVFPLYAYAVVAFLPLSQTFKTAVLVLSAAPCASMILTLAEQYECEQRLSANLVLLATMCSLITLPLLMLIV